MSTVRPELRPGARPSIVLAPVRNEEQLKRKAYHHAAPHMVPAKQYDPRSTIALEGSALTLEEYVGAASVSWAREKGDASVGCGGGGRGGRGFPPTKASKGKSVRFTPGTPGSAASGSDGEGPEVPDSEHIWSMPPPAKFDYEWRYVAPAQVIVHGVDVNAKGATSRLRSDQENRSTKDWQSQLPALPPIGGAERRRRKRIAENRRSLRTPWLSCHGHVRRAPVAPNGARLFPHASSSLLGKSVKRKRDRKLKIELRQLERELVADAPKTHTESEHRGRIIGDMLDLREELVRTIASPWQPRMGRRR